MARVKAGFRHCPKRNIYFCFMCAYRLQNLQYKFPPECPMCGGDEDIIWEYQNEYGSVYTKTGKKMTNVFRAYKYSYDNPSLSDR